MNTIGLTLDERETTRDELAGGMTLAQYAQWLWARTHDVEYDIEQQEACSAATDRMAPTAPPPVGL